MPNNQSIEDAVEGYYLGLDSLGGMFSNIVTLLVNGDIDVLMSGLPVETNDWLMWELRDAYSPIRENDPQNYIIIEGVTIFPGREEAYYADRARREEHLRSVEVPKLQNWLRKHPLARREAFPVDLVRGLQSRIDHEYKAISAMQPPGLTLKQRRARPDRQKLIDYGSIGAALMNAIHRAELNGSGSQEQALAWEGFDRVARLCVMREALSGAEQTLVDAAQARREDHLGSIGRSAPGTRGVHPR